MRVSRSLTIRQMAMVVVVVMVFVFISYTVLLFHLVQQNRCSTAMQPENIIRSVREPLSDTILEGDTPEAEAILKSIRPAGVVSRTDVVLPNQFRVLRMSFIPEHPAPATMTRLFELPIQISLSIYSLERSASPQPLVYLVLQAGSYHMCKFVMGTLSTLVTIYLLSSLILTVVISRCISRLIVHPLRKIARELNDIQQRDLIDYQLTLPHLYRDDEIGVPVRSYNLNQQLIQQHSGKQSDFTMCLPVSKLPSKSFLMGLLKQAATRQQTTALVIVTCETLHDITGILTKTQQGILLLTPVEKLKPVLVLRMMSSQVGGYDFAIITHGVKEPWHAIALGQQVLTIISERSPTQGVQLRPTCNIGVAMFYGDLTAEQLYRRVLSAMLTSRHKGKNQIQFFDPLQTGEAQQRLMEENGIPNTLDNQQFTLWIQPQVGMSSDKVLSAETSLRIQQPDGSWELPEGLVDRIESCGLMMAVDHWALEETCCRLSAWQERDLILPLSVNSFALQLVHSGMVSGLLELLNRCRIEPGTLILEATESRHIDDLHVTVAILHPLCNAGACIALDNFGMGYAGLRQLWYMEPSPVDVLKIDKMFVDGIPEDCSMISTIIQLAHSPNLQTIAEGTRTETQHE